MAVDTLWCGFCDEEYPETRKGHYCQFAGMVWVPSGTTPSAPTPAVTDAPERLPVDLVVPGFVRGVAAALGFGKAKYGRAWGWLTDGHVWSKDYAAAQRHLLAWADGQDADPESGLPHLALAAARIMILMTMTDRGAGKDDRQKTEAKR